MTEIASDSLQDAGPLLILAVVIFFGVLFGEAAKRIRLPSVTGQIVAGALLGRAGLNLFGDEALHALQPLTFFALGLIAVTVGAHLNIRRLGNAGRRLVLLLVTESTITPLFVLLVIWGLGGLDIESSILLAAVAIATAPATIVALVKESHAKGVFVKTLIAAVALNNMACIVAFEVARAAVRGWSETHQSVAIWLAPLAELGIAAVIGAVAALVVEGVARVAVHADRLATAAVVALVFTSGMAMWMDVSPLLACLFLGFIQTNLSRAPNRLVDSVFADFEPAILAVFFTLAGMHLSFEHIGVAGILAALYVLSRVLGKLVAADVAMRLAQATERVRLNLGMALVPQAGVAVGLVIVIQEDPRFADISGLFSAVVLTAVTVNEIIGPVLTRLALARTGEMGKDRMRLIDFLQEENIVTSFAAGSKGEAIEKLVDLLIRSHSLPGIDRSTLLESVLDRERQGSTCLGGGLAVPHCILPEGMPMVGVMALSREGLELDAPDDVPIRCMVLLGTSLEERERHLQVLAVLARTVGIDLAFQDQLFNALSPAHAYELLHGEESEDLNYFLEDRT